MRVALIRVSLSLFVKRLLCQDWSCLLILSIIGCQKEKDRWVTYSGRPKYVDGHELTLQPNRLAKREIQLSSQLIPKKSDFCLLIFSPDVFFKNMDKISEIFHL